MLTTRCAWCGETLLGGSLYCPGCGHSTRAEPDDSNAASDHAPGFRFGREGLRGRVGVNHLPLADLLNAVLDAGLLLDRVVEPGADGFPLLLGFRAAR